MRQLSVDISEISPESLELALAEAIRTLKRRRVKASVAPQLPTGGMIRVAKTIIRGPYTFRYLEAFGYTRDIAPQMLGRLDTLYGKEIIYVAGNHAIIESPSY